MVTLLHISIAASPLILCIALVRLFWWEKIPPRVLLMLWMLALCRLLTPYWLPVKNERIKPLLNHVYGGVYNFTYLGVAAAPSRELLIFIWSAAGLALLAFVVFRHLRSLKMWRVALPIERPAVQEWVTRHAGLRRVRVLTYDQTNNIFSYGLLRPVIVLSSIAIKDLSDDEVIQVTAHELGHIRGLHALLQYLFLGVCCLYWFNPLVWLMVWIARRDLELAADATAQRFLGPETAQTYGSLLFNLTTKATPGLVSSWFAPSLKERLEAIITPKKKSLVIIALTIILVLTLFALLISVPLAAIEEGAVTGQHFYRDETVEKYSQRLNKTGYILVEDENLN